MTHNTQAVTATNQVQGAALIPTTNQPSNAAQQVTQNLVHQWANAWANGGYPVFPVRANVKAAAIKQWPTLASTDPEAFHGYWQANPHPNIAIHCEGLVVIDIDTQAGHGKDGYAFLPSLRLMVGDDLLCTCLCVLTPSGGLHLYFRLPDGVRVTSGTDKLASGVDVKTNGGYVLAPGSMIDGKPYTLISLSPERLDILVAHGENAVEQARLWTCDHLPILSELPEAPLALLQALQVSPVQPLGPTGTVKPIAPPDTPLPEDQNALAKAFDEQISAGGLDPDSYDDWNKAIFACTHAVEKWRWDEGETQNTLFKHFCRNSTKYDETQNLRQWDICLKRASNGAATKLYTLRSIFYGTSVMPGVSDAATLQATSGQPTDTTNNAPTVIALGCEEEDKGWARLVRVTNANGKEVEVELLMKDFDGRGDLWLPRLRDAGLTGEYEGKKKTALKLNLSSANHSARYMRVRAIGWQGKRFYIPDIMEDSDMLFRLIDPPQHNVFSQKGSLHTWQQNLAVPCARHERLVFVLSMGLIGPLLHPLGLEGFGFHFFGPSSTGKSTALRLGCSLWGNPGDFKGSWRATDNGLEAIMQARNHTLMALDELGQATSKVAAESAYMLANGAGKTRASRNASARKTVNWCLPFFSTGEMPLATKIQEDARQYHTAGMDVRMFDIPADAGAGFGLLNDTGGADPAHIIDTLNATAKIDYGHAGAAFIEALVRHLKQPNGLVQLREYLSAYASRFVPQGASSQVTRAAERFALAALAGEYAIAWDVLPWEPNAALNAAKSVFDAWLAQRETSGQLEPLQIVNKVLAFTEQYGSIRFDEFINNIVPDTYKARGERAGFKRKNDDGGYDYFIFSSYMHEFILPGVDKELIRTSLAKCGILRLDGNGKLASTTLPGFKKTRYYIINPETLS